jgi:hypothetical protein
MKTAERALLIAVASVLANGLLLACEDEAREERATSAATEASPAPNATDAAAIERARGAAKQLGQTLKQRLVAAMGEGGPPAAIEVCANEAPTIAARVSEETGVRVGRSSLRLRNPANGGPSWVSAWLATQGERRAEGVEGFARIEDGEARVLVPIAVEGLCVNCHGPDEALLPEVRRALSARYAHDRATGYSEGDLRGALWAAAPL